MVCTSTDETAAGIVAIAGITAVSIVAVDIAIAGTVAAVGLMTPAIGNSGTG